MKVLFNIIKQWLPILIVIIGCLYFIYDNVKFLINFHTWVPDREINLWTSISMLISSIITLFNVGWLILVIRTQRPPLILMKPILAVTGALSFIFALSLAGLIMMRINQVNTIENPIILITLLTISIIITTLRLWQITFKGTVH